LGNARDCGGQGHALASGRSVDPRLLTQPKQLSTSEYFNGTAPTTVTYMYACLISTTFVSTPTSFFIVIFCPATNFSPQIFIIHHSLLCFYFNEKLGE